MAEIYIMRDRLKISTVSWRRIHKVEVEAISGEDVQKRRIQVESTWSRYYVQV
jgi:hypothetical protein